MNGKYKGIFIRSTDGFSYPANDDSFYVGYTTEQTGYKFAVDGTGYFNGNLKATTYGTALVTDTEIGYVDGATSNIQDQINSKTSNVGTVTSVDLSVPTGFTISNNPITTTGTLALSFTTGYSLPTNTKQGQWDTAYGWGDHSDVGYLTGTKVDSFNTRTGAVTLTKSDVEGVLTGLITSHTHNYNNYSLPLSAAGTRGGVQIGYTENGKNYPVELSSEKMFVNVPWTDTVYSHPNHTGHVTSTEDGATVLTVSAITGQTELASGLVSTDELLLSDGGVIKRMDVSVLETYMQDNLNFGNALTDGDKGDITVASSGTSWTIDSGTITAAKVNSNFISGQTVRPGGTPAGTDKFILDAAGSIYYTTIDDLQDFIQLNIADDTAYNESTWNNDTEPATKNAIRDKFEDLDTNGTTFSQGVNDYGTTRLFSVRTTSFNTSSNVQVFEGTSNQTWYLPALSNFDTGEEYTVCNNSSGAYDLNIKPYSSETINHYNNTQKQVKLLSPGDNVTLKKLTSSNWAIISLFGQFN